MSRDSRRREYTKEIKRLRKKYHSTTHYVLSSLIPYTESNIKLTFKPSLYFVDLERLSSDQYKSGALRGSYYRAIKQGLVRLDDHGVPRLTDKGSYRLRRYEPRKLKGAAGVLVVFDIPESERRLRRQLRVLLRELQFRPIQQSVWQSEYDVLEYLTPELRQHGLDRYVQVHEAVRII